MNLGVYLDLNTGTFLGIDTPKQKRTIISCEPELYERIREVVKS